MGIDFEPLSTVSLSRQIADKIREAILSGSLQADDRLPTEEELAAKFDVSRPTIREALKRLAAQNLVRSRRGPTGGTFVNRPKPSDLSEGLTSAMTLLVGMGEFELDEINLARWELETLCCRLAAQNRQQEHLEQMTMELKLQQQDDLTPEEFCASDVRFHRAIADGTQNGVLRFVMFAVIEALQPIANMIAFRFRERELIVDQHERLLQALNDRDEALAVSVIQEQIDYLHQQQLKAQANRR
ncbi:FadR/GntR family transcriptional regulator [Solemya velesiana gill symbiont]|uniref:GntR family transcriptional regulator n=1 Tax=Solemya velesiana gill symbiont TaxID=1918948 RepID=A0A1T2KTM6_9GAMM|nr:FadR/GntR family transcriptional regulator [Solemya velesiana gill symbiont]OOZ36207.1 GntR family transcriptional regulator [Solemya velesiana gill symbiont]